MSDLKHSEGKQKDSIRQYLKTILVFLDSTQAFFLVLLIPFLIWAPYFLKSVYDVVEMNISMRPDFEGPRWSDFYLLAITLPSIALGKYISFQLFSKFYDRNLPSKHQGELRAIKIEKGCENIFKTFYFTAISLYGYYAVLVKLPFESPVIGNGSWHDYFKDHPYGPFLRASTYYCIWNLSYHTESAIQIIIHPRNDFFEMICHHVCSVLVIANAYVCSYYNQAVLFMIVIDNADIFIGLVRVFMEITSNKIILLTIYAVLMVSFADENS